jgi:hypothetical protein
MAKKVLFVPKKEEVLTFSKEVIDLLMKGRLHGYISMQEMIQAIPEPESNIEELDQIFDYMFRKRIEFKEEAEKPKGILSGILQAKKEKSFIEELGLEDLADDSSGCIKREL